MHVREDLCARVPFPCDRITNLIFCEVPFMPVLIGTVV